MYTVIAYALEREVLSATICINYDTGIHHVQSTTTTTTTTTTQKGRLVHSQLVEDNSRERMVPTEYETHIFTMYEADIT